MSWSNTRPKHTSRGAKALLTGAFVAAVLLLSPRAAAGAAGVDAAVSHALIGEWEFDPSQSVFIGAIPYREAQIAFRRTTECIEVKQRILEGTARELKFSYCDRHSGERVPVIGNPFYDGESTLWADERTAIRTEYRGEKISGTTTMIVAADGNTYTATASRTLPNGKLYTSKIVWKRVKRGR